MVIDGSPSMFTITSSEAVHPFAGSVAVTVYVFGLDTTVEEEVAPSLHAKLAPLAPELAVKVTDVIKQVNFVSTPAFTDGGVMF